MPISAYQSHICQKKKGKKKELTTLGLPEKDISLFTWRSEYQMAFDTLKVALITAPVLGYPDFTKKIILETNASLKGQGAVLSKEDNTGKVCIIAYTSGTLRPSEQSIHNYSSAKLELLAFKGDITQKYLGIFAGVKIMVYNDNNSLAYIPTSKSNESQICWLSELSLIDFNIQHHSG